MRPYTYSFEFKPSVQKFLFREMYLNKQKKEPEILKRLIAGETCSQIGMAVGYSKRTIERKRKELGERTNQILY